MESDYIRAIQTILDQTPECSESGRSGALIGFGGAVTGVFETVQQVDGGYHKR